MISDPHMVRTQHTDIFRTSTSTSTTVNGSQKVVNLGVCGVCIHMTAYLRYLKILVVTKLIRSLSGTYVDTTATLGDNLDDTTPNPMEKMKSA